jgi:superfamily I DNA/RNA helicase
MQGSKIKCYQAEDALQEAKYIIREIEKQVGGFHQLTGGATHHTGNYAFPDIAILFRTHAVGRELLTLLKQSDIPVHMSDGAAFLANAPFSVIADILRIYMHPRDMVALHGILHHALGWEKQETRTFLSWLHENELNWQEANPAAVSKKAREHFLQWKDFYKQLPAYFTQHGVGGAVQAMFRQYLPDQQLTEEQLLKKDTILTLAAASQADVHQFLEDTTLNIHTGAAVQQAYGIHLLTFHAAKGLEFPLVFIAGAEDGITPSGRKDTDPEEERRLFYVGITRAKEELHITHTAKRILYGKEQQQEISPFVKDIPAALCELVKPGNRQKEKNKTDQDQLSLF